MKNPIFPPHFRLIFLFLWGITVSLIAATNILWLLNIGAFCLLSAIIFRQKKSLPDYGKRWFFLNLFTVLIWLTLSWKIGTHGIEINPDGMHVALLISLRMNLILLSGWILLMDMNDSILVQALSRLPLPAKLIQLFILTVRYIALLAEINRKIELAMRARGYRTTFNRRTLNITAQRVALLLIHAMLKAEQAQIALKARGFTLEKSGR